MPRTKRTIRPLHVSLVAIPEGSISTLHGLYDVLGSFGLLPKLGSLPDLLPYARATRAPVRRTGSERSRGDSALDDAVPTSPPFRVEIVATSAGPVRLASGLTAHAHRGIDELGETDIVVVPSVVLPRNGWLRGRYPALVEWAARAHARGASLCSACSGIFLLAETGIFDGRDATMHWSYAPTFQRVFPRVRLFPERALVVSGARSELVSSGASMSWHDLVLYLIARHVGPTAAQSVAKFFALQWHRDGLGPYIVFEGRRDHGDAAVLAAQAWLEKSFSVASPVEEMVRRSGMAERTFKRRFTEATGLAPLHYVQQLRVEEAKRRLERTRDAIDEIGWRVGYEDPAFFRRLFKRITGVTPAAYRKQLQVPVPETGLARRS